MNPYIEQPNGCWHWTGSLDRQGYGVQRHEGAHRIAYREAKGPIPAGLVIDHTCHNRDPFCPEGDACLHRRCVNPDHLEAVTHEVNMNRSRARRLWCGRGHDLVGWNVIALPDGQRECRECSAIRRREYEKTRPRPSRYSYKPPPRPCIDCGEPTRSIKQQCLPCYRVEKLAERAA